MGIVSLKGNKYGVSVNISVNASFEDIKVEIAKCFRDANRVFRNEKLALGFEGRLLTSSEREELLDIIRDNCELDIVCVMDFNVGTEERFRRAVEKFSEPEPESVPTPVQEPVLTEPEEEIIEASEPVYDTPAEPVPAYEPAPQIIPEDLSKIAKFYKGNVRSGVLLNEDCSLVILGDVSIGGEVISKGNIIVLGALRGNAFAGSDGNENCFVAALTMNPMQVRIGNIMARCGDSGNSKEEHEPEIAFVKNNTIAIELINRTVLNDINL